MIPCFSQSSCDVFSLSLKATGTLRCEWTTGFTLGSRWRRYLPSNTPFPFKTCRNCSSSSSTTGDFVSLVIVDNVVWLTVMMTFSFWIFSRLIVKDVSLPIMGLQLRLLTPTNSILYFMSFLWFLILINDFPSGVIIVPSYILSLLVFSKLWCTFCSGRMLQLAPVSISNISSCCTSLLPPISWLQVVLCISSLLCNKDLPLCPVRRHLHTQMMFHHLVHVPA